MVDQWCLAQGMGRLHADVAEAGIRLQNGDLSEMKQPQEKLRPECPDDTEKEAQQDQTRGSVESQEPVHDEVVTRKRIGPSSRIGQIN